MIRITILAFAAIISLIITARITRNKNDPASTDLPTGAIGVKTNNERISSTLKILRSKAVRLHLHTGIGMLVDLSVHSGTNRFWVADLQRDSVLMAGLVTHGYGNSTAEKAGYSNQPGSCASSPGAYRIGRAYTGRFGKAYKLYGLDSSNSNAFQRFVVLHAHACVPNQEVYPQTICMSQGCPTVSPAFFQQLSTVLDTVRKPLLLQILP